MVVGSNPDTVYWMDVSDARELFQIKNNKNKGSEMGHIKKIKKEASKTYMLGVVADPVALAKYGL